MSTWMRDIFNRTHPSMGQPTPTPAGQSGSEENFGAIIDNIPQPMPPAPNPQGAMNGLMSNFNPPAPQGANMPQPQRQSWLDGLMANFNPPTPQVAQNMAGGLDQQMPMGGMFGGITSTMPKESDPMSYGMFGGGAPQGNPMQMPSAPFQSGMRAGSVGNQMGGLNNMYSNFAAPSPMPAAPPPMFGAPAGNSRAMMGPKPVGLF